MISNEKLNSPFDEDIFKQASELADDYGIIIESNESLGFVGHGVEFLTVFGDGKTKKECKENVKKAITVAIAYLLENNKELPDIKE